MILKKNFQKKEINKIKEEKKIIFHVFQQKFTI